MRQESQFIFVQKHSPASLASLAVLGILGSAEDASDSRLGSLEAALTLGSGLVIIRMVGFVPGLPLQMLSRELGNLFELGFVVMLYKPVECCSVANRTSMSLVVYTLAVLDGHRILATHGGAALSIYAL